MQSPTNHAKGRIVAAIRIDEHVLLPLAFASSALQGLALGNDSPSLS